ncbi:MAG: RNA 3'-terminal phosphate cyclase [Nanobdellota archaeon]
MSQERTCASDESLPPFILDCNSGAGTGGSVRLAIIASALTKKPVTLKNICCERGAKSGLSMPLLAFIETMSSATEAEVKGAGVGSETLTFTPKTEFPSKRKLELNLDGPHSIALSLLPLAMAALYAPKKMTLHATGMTHGKNAPTIDVLRESFLRPLMPYAHECRLETKKMAFYPDHDGEVMLAIDGKHELDTACLQFKLEKQSQLAAIRARIVASKELAAKDVVERAEQLLRLAFRDKEVPIVVDTQYVSSTEHACAVSIHGLFGDEEGYDNDKPWIQSADAYLDDDAIKNNFDTIVYGLIREFEEKLYSPSVDAKLAEQILPLLALQGGEMDVSQVTERLKGYIAVLEQVLGVDVEVNDTTIACKGYASQNVPRIKDLNEL